MDKGAVDRGLERLLDEEREQAESEMRAGIAGTRASAGDYSVTMGEMAGFHYSLINTVREVISKTHLPIMVAKAIVDAYTWDRPRTLEAACEYKRGELPRHLDLKPDMKTKKWIEIRQAIEAEPDLEVYRCKKAQLYIYLMSRSPQYRSICKKGEDLMEERRLRRGQH